jgi:hypothetical protein
MAQHDYVIDNQASAAARADMNNLFQAIASQNSGATAPATTYANMIWYDTSTDLLKIRNEANSGWITVGTVDQTNNVFNPNFLPATQVEAEAGTNNTKGMTALRVAQAIAALSPAFASGVNIQAFTATGTYTPTTGYKWGIAFVTGGGGGGNGASSGMNNGQGGGGAGGTAINVLNLTTLGAVSATIGAGGTAGSTSGGAGGTGGSSILSTLTGVGGSGGGAPTGGAGGTPTGGIMNIVGGQGMDGLPSGDQQVSGGGGGSFWGSGAKRSTNVGVTGQVYGSGASGAAGGASRLGGVGKSGVIMIMEFK